MARKAARLRQGGVARARAAQQAAELRAREEAARRRRWYLIAAVAAAVLGVIAAVALLGLYNAKKPPAAPAASANSVPFASVTIANGKPITIGAATAPHTVTTYLDYRCNYCLDFEKKYASEVRQLVEQGRAKLELYPLGFLSPASAAASNAVACASEAGFGLPYHEGLFANPTLEWNDGQLLSLARQVSPGVPASFDTCVTSKAHAAWVTGLYEIAKLDKAKNGTPEVYVDDARFDWVGSSPADLAELVAR